jgi:hypothetical protein
MTKIVKDKEAYAQLLHQVCAGNHGMLIGGQLVIISSDDLKLIDTSLGSYKVAQVPGC